MKRLRQVAAGIEPAPAKTAAKEDDGTVKVGACDGGDAVEVSKELTGKPLADSLLDQWKRNHPEATWVAEEKERHTLKPPADNADLLKGGQGKGDTYGNFTERDLLTWARETEKFAAEGSRIFHNADKLGSTVAVSCDMCHPHAANTHPETYPKFQVQLGRVVLLRDMINWCIENPVRGKQVGSRQPEDAGLGGLYHGAAERRSHELRQTLIPGIWMIAWRPSRSSSWSTSAISPSCSTRRSIRSISRCRPSKT